MVLNWFAVLLRNKADFNLVQKEKSFTKDYNLNQALVSLSAI